MGNFLEFRRTFTEEILEYADKKINIKKGTYLGKDYLKNEKILILKKGLIRYSHIMEGGKEILFGCYREYVSFIIGELFSKSINDESLADMFIIEVSEDSEIYFISEETVKEKILKNKILSEKLVEYYVSFYQKQFFQMRDIQFLNIEDAILSLAVRIYNTYGDTINEKNGLMHKILNKNIAKCIGCSEETVCRAIIKLKKQGMISRENGVIAIKNIDVVKERLGCKFCKESICYF